MTKLYNTTAGPVAELSAGRFRLLDCAWDSLITSEQVPAPLRGLERDAPAGADLVAEANLLPPIGNQEVWAAGVTYLRSKVARMEESGAAGGGSFYDRVYDAARPELFFKA